jgi:hypothetical protein
MILDTTQARIVACSLEIDGRADIAAQAITPGHVSEFTYRRGKADSAKARGREETQAAITAAIEARGLPAVIAELRTATQKSAEGCPK